MLLYVTICYGNCSSVSWLSHGKGIKSVKASQSYQAPVDLCRPFQFPPRNLQSWLMELPLAKKKKRENMKTPSSCLVIGFLAILSFLSLDHNRIMILQECQCSAFIRACWDMRVLAHNVALSEFVRLTILNIPIWFIVSAQIKCIYIYTDHKRSHKITIYPYETACKSRTTKLWQPISISTSATTRGLVVAVVDLDQALNVS